jgi:4-aminobutyrate aminotransferase-like enzyme
MSIEELDMLQETEPAAADLEGEGLMWCVPIVSCFMHLSGF